MLGTGVYAADPGRFLRDDTHVCGIGSGIGCSNVLPLQRVDEAPHRPKEVWRFVSAWTTDDHCLATPELEACKCRFVCHAAGESQHIPYCLESIGIGPHATSAQSGSPAGVV